MDKTMVKKLLDSLRGLSNTYHEAASRICAEGQDPFAVYSMVREFQNRYQHVLSDGK